MRKEPFTWALSRELQAPSEADVKPKRVQLPIFSSPAAGTVEITPADLRRMEEEDDRRRSGLKDEPPDFESTWREVTSTLMGGSTAETDAYLAAMAISGDWTLATFDKGFRRFTGLSLEFIAA